MTYNKPEVAILGDASRFIQGGKSDSAELANVDDLQDPGFEIED